jgi:hypothetical protein
MAYRRFVLDEVGSRPATSATSATAAADPIQSVADVAGVAACSAESAAPFEVALASLLTENPTNDERR